MSLRIYSSHRENCTLGNALVWGMCRSHFYQVQAQTQLQSRIYHLALALLEIIPVIGQIVSLIELKIIQIYTRPQPTSCIPQITTVTYQETPADIRRIWPTDLKKLGLTEFQKTEVDRHVRDAFRAIMKGGKLTYAKKRLTYTHGTLTVDAILPITLCIIQGKQEPAEFSVLLFSKVIFASGGERKIRWVYDLTMGTFFLKKRITGPFEENLLNYLLPLRLERGIKTSVLWRTVSDKQNKEKRQIIESVRDGTLQTLFGTAPLSNFSVKRDLILDLLIDLHALHLGRLSGVTLTQNSPFNNTQTQELSYHTFHSDIKPLNVLVFIQNGKWRAELCDFGFGAAHPVAFVISIGFTPPEYIRFYQEKRPFGIDKVSAKDSFDIARFNIQHGHGRDVWDLGLVIISLLIEREVEAVWINVNENCRKRTHIPPLPCLQAMLSDRISGHYDEKGILGLKQETLDADLDQLEREIAYKHPQERKDVARVSEMLKKMMLRINPTERKTVADCIAFMQQEPLKTV